MMRFHEYMNSKGKVDKPVVKMDGDRTDPMTPPNKPPKGGKPYSVKDGKSKKSNKGLGDQGHADLKYTPSVDNDSKGKAPAKLPTVEQVELVSVLTREAAANPALVETVIRQFKSKGLLGAVVAEMLNHKEAYHHLSEVMAHESYGPDVCSKLVRAMKEETALPFSDALDTEDEEIPEDGEDELGLEDEDGMPFGDDEDDMPYDDDEDMSYDDEDPNVDMEEDPNMMDPSMMGDPNMMDPNMDPSMAGMDPNMMGNPAMANFQRAMMRMYQRAMMGKR